MANHQIPRRARRIEQIHGIDADGQVVTCAVYEHTRAGHSFPMFYTVQYREAGRRIDRPTRITNQLSGPGARQRLAAELAGTRQAMEDSRLAEHARLFGQVCACCPEQIARKNGTGDWQHVTENGQPVTPYNYGAGGGRFGLHRANGGVK